MSRILITSGPTREYLDPVRYLTNGSSGRMGAALAAESIRRGHETVVVSGPVQIEYLRNARVIRVVSTREMANACLAEFPDCDGVIAAAAPCDIGPKTTLDHKESKSDLTTRLEWIETPDIIAELGKRKRPGQWSVAFALETHRGVERALEKLRRKNCDLIVLNDASAIDATVAQAQIIGGDGSSRPVRGTKLDIAAAIFDAIESQLVVKSR